MELTSEVLQAISRWRQEAWDEASDKYFFKIPIVDDLLSGEVRYVVSRKGTGKSALAKHIASLKEPNTFTTVISLEDFPYEDFRARMGVAEGPDIQKYELAWQYIIYWEIAQLMHANERASGSGRETLRQIFDKKSLATMAGVRRWTSVDFWFEMVEKYLKVARADREDHSIRERCSSIRQFVSSNIDNAKYVLVFDGLDQGFHHLDSKQMAEFVAIVSGVFAAVQAVRKELNSKKVFPIVFLRDDIYGLVASNDRGKYRDYQAELLWSLPLIKQLLAFRIARAAQVPSSLSFDDAWNALCGGKLEFTVGRLWDKFDYISSFTFQRPRDYIYYLARASRIALERAQGKAHVPVLSGDVLKGSAKEFSRHLREEIEDEMGGEFRHIKSVMDVLERLERRVFSQKDFDGLYKQHHPEAWAEWPTGQVLQKLFAYSVVGNQNGDKEFFQYMSAEKDAYRKLEEQLRKGGRVVIHKGLARDWGVG